MKKLFFLALATVLSFTMFAQSNYRVVSGKNMVKGTSSLHDWQCVVEKQSGSAVINTSGTLSIPSLTVTMDASSMKSVKADGKYYDASMDKNMYKALNTAKYPNIVYTLTSISNVKTTGNTSTFNATGNLTVAGKTNRVTFPVKAVVAGNNVTFTGTTKFKMTSFDIKPPTALLGTIKTGDDVTIVFNTTFSK